MRLTTPLGDATIVRTDSDSVQLTVPGAESYELGLDVADEPYAYVVRLLDGSWLLAGRLPPRSTDLRASATTGDRVHTAARNGVWAVHLAGRTIRLVFLDSRGGVVYEEEGSPSGLPSRNRRTARSTQTIVSRGSH